MAIVKTATNVSYVDGMSSASLSQGLVSGEAHLGRGQYHDGYS